MFKLKRPCKSCPFQRGMGERFQLPPERLEEIRTAPAFQCHATVDYDAYEDDVLRQGDKPQQCAGLMAVLMRMGEPNQIMRVAMRTGWDPADLDPDGAAYPTWIAVRKAHRRTR